MANKTQVIISDYAEKVSKELRTSEIGSHFFVEYPDLQTFREMYSHYTKSALYDGNEIVVILPFYETPNNVRRVLSEDSACIDVRKHEKEQRLLIMDSLRGYFGSVHGLMPFVKQTVEYAKSSGRSNVTVLGDMGSFFYYDKQNALIEYEMQLPHTFDTILKGICLYHTQDIKRLLEEDKQELVQHHSEAMKLLPTPIGS